MKKGEDVIEKNKGQRTTNLFIRFNLRRVTAHWAVCGSVESLQLILSLHSPSQALKQENIPVHDRLPWKHLCVYKLRRRLTAVFTHSSTCIILLNTALAVL